MVLQGLAALVLAATPVTLPASDGKSVAASWHPAADASEIAKAPAVVLVADAGKTRDDWKKAADALGGAGLSVLAIEPRKLGKNDAFGKAVPDVAAALKWLAARKDVNGQRILVIGAGDGAMVALAAGASDMADLGIAGLGLISPVVDGSRLDDATALGDYGARPFFVATAKGDKKSSMSALVLDSNAKGEKKIHISEGSRKGTELLAADDKVMTALVEWAKGASGLAAKAP